MCVRGKKGLGLSCSEMFMNPSPGPTPLSSFLASRNLILPPVPDLPQAQEGPRDWGGMWLTLPPQSPNNTRIMLLKCICIIIQQLIIQSCHPRVLVFSMCCLSYL